jgi:SAM-dependent methyltransferase
VTVQELTQVDRQRSDPFAAPPRMPVADRPRLLSYVGRWGRARRWLPADALRILDIGCSYGYGSAAIVGRGPAGRMIVGVERDPQHLAMAGERFPGVQIIDADATDLPVCTGCADAVLLLDVIEHLADPGRAVAEAHRVLRPGGVLVLSVPHSGLLRRLDALNVYSSLRRRRPSWPPLETATESGAGRHRHFAVDELERLVEPWFGIERITRTGLGVAEFVQISRLLLRATRDAPRTCAALAWLYLLVYLAEDPFPLGPLAYHLTVRARANPTNGAA